MIQPNFKIKKVKLTANFGQFVFEPLPQGYGHTLGNALRRVLLTSLPGTAITEVKISGVRHKFSTIPGVKEDVIEILLNLKEVRIKYEGEKPVRLLLEKTGPGEVRAGDIETPAGVEIVNKDLVLGNLADNKTRLKMEMVAEKGYGYLTSEERKSEKLGQLILDAIFSPVLRVSYKVEATRVGGQTDLDKLVLEVTTDGTIDPYGALCQGVKTLASFLNQIINPKNSPSSEKKKASFLSSPDVLKLTIEELELPTRIVNALQKAGYRTLGKLAKAKKSDLVSVKNLGEKSLNVILEILKKKGINPVWGGK